MTAGNLGHTVPRFLLVSLVGVGPRMARFPNTYIERDSTFLSIWRGLYIQCHYNSVEPGCVLK